MGDSMRYLKNGIFSNEEMDLLKTSKVCIIGCGGLGGYILEMIGRVGVGHITIIDGDTFNVTNLNRQLLSDESNLGKSKVLCGKERMKKVNSEVEFTYVDDFFTKGNALDLLRGHDLVIDALDSLESRFLLQETCEALKIPFVHGAIAGWYGQVSTVYPGDKTMTLIYGSPDGKGIEGKLGNPSFTPANIASIQVAEGLKVLLKKDNILRHKLLYIDLLNNEYQIIELN